MDNVQNTVAPQPAPQPVQMQAAPQVGMPVPAQPFASAPRSYPVLQTQGLCKNFGSQPALSNINLALQPGRIVGLLGPNGSGKTTLIKIVAGLLAPTQGLALINGATPGPQTKALVSYLPDRVYFSGWMRVRDCVKLFADFYADFDQAKAFDMLRALGIDINKRFKTLSKGMQEKVQLSLVMSRRAQLYLLDEPIGGVDPASRDFILETIIKNYNEDGTVIISTHLIYDIERVLDDVIFLMNGQIERFVSVDYVRETSGKSVDEVFREVFRC